MPWVYAHLPWVYAHFDRIIAALTLIAAILAVYYTKVAPSKRDLERVEGKLAEAARGIEAVRANTAATEGHLAEQRKRDLLHAKAALVSIIAEGSAWDHGPVDVNFSIEGSAARLRRIDMLNRHAFALGTLECREVTPARFSVTIDTLTLSRWREEGNSLSLATRVTVRLRAYLEIGGEETDKQFSITTYDSLQSKPGEIRTRSCMRVSGGC